MPRQSDQNSVGANSTSLTLSSALGTGSNSLRRFAGHKISKVRFLADQAEFTGRLVTGSWNLQAPAQGGLNLWQVNGLGSGMDNLERANWLPVGPGVDVNDIFVINNQQFVASMSNGDVKIVNCGALSADGGDDESAANGNNNGGGRQPSKMVTMATYPRVHRQAASTAVCVLESEIFSGSDTGQIVRIQPASRTANPVRPFVEDLMGVTALCPCGQFQMVSAHSTGQIHLWDVRTRSQSPQFGIEPLNSRPVTELNNSITALAAHPSQNSVLGFGTRDGVVSFVDIRQSGQPLPVAFKVSQEPIHELKFHPIFANNCFSLSDSSIIHWDGSMLARQSNPLFNLVANDGNDLSVVNGQEAELIAAMETEEAGNEHRNIWLSARASTNMQLRTLVEEEPRLLSSFDIVQGALVAASHTAELMLLSGVNFTN